MRNERAGSISSNNSYLTNYQKSPTDRKYPKKRTRFHIKVCFIFKMSCKGIPLIFYTKMFTNPELSQENCHKFFHKSFIVLHHSTTRTQLMSKNWSVRPLIPAGGSISRPHIPLETSRMSSMDFHNRRGGR